MTWLHVYDLLRAQLRYFPNGDIRPFAPLPTGGWSTIEAMLCQDEEKNRSIVDVAIGEFIERGSWTSNLSDRQRVWIYARLDFGSGVALHLSVPLSADGFLLPMPATVSDHDILNWLLVTQWLALGFDDWLSELKLLFENRSSKHKAPWYPTKIVPGIPRDLPPDWTKNN